MVLKTLDATGAQHGYDVARRLERLSEGTVYTALPRLVQQGWIATEWGISENNRRAKFYSGIIGSVPAFAGQE
jgi:PadR family transcriptional regulator, regulatory protein PadR